MAMADAKTAIVLQHVASEGPLAIGDALVRRGIALRTVRTFREEVVPASLDGAVALIVMGGPMGVYEAARYPHLVDEMRLIENAVRAEVPVLGVCLGSQLVAAALGARVAPASAKEIGFHEVTLREAAASDRLFAGVDARFHALHWHGDVFDLPSGAVSLARSAMTEHQAFRYGASTYGLLFHLEATHALVDAMIGAFGEDLARGGIAEEGIRDGARKYLGGAGEIGSGLFGRFAALTA